MQSAEGLAPLLLRMAMIVASVTLVHYLCLMKPKICRIATGMGAFGAAFYIHYDWYWYLSAVRFLLVSPANLVVAGYIVLYAAITVALPIWAYSTARNRYGKFLPASHALRISLAVASEIYLPRLIAEYVSVTLPTIKAQGEAYMTLLSIISLILGLALYSWISSSEKILKAVWKMRYSSAE